jgi:hypothetical protein
MGYNVNKVKPRKNRNKSRDYVNDKELTDLLLKEIEERKQGLRKGPSNELAEKFLLILDKILTSYKYKNYTDLWKDEFKSFAIYLFAAHWYKFKPERAQKNYYTRNGEKILKDEKDFEGAVGYFTLLVTTAIHDTIRKLKAEREKIHFLEDELKEELKHKINH